NSVKENEEKFKDDDKNKNLLNLINDAANFNEITNSSWSTTPYNSAGDGIALLYNNNNEKKREKINPEDKTVFIFPGQGTLKVGDVEKYLNYPRVKKLFDIANEILGYNIMDICLNGPQSKLNKTEFNQPATILTSLAALEKIWEDNSFATENCIAAAGYSVGELTALIFSGALTIEDGIRLAGIRGAGMQYAVDQQPNQGMLTIISKHNTKVNKACQEARNFSTNLGLSLPICQIAIYLCSETKVLAGHQQALEYIINNSYNLNFRKIFKLPVTGAFHTPLMKPALKSFVKALDDIEFQQPRIPVYSNVTAKPYRSIKDIINLLPKQIISPVKWEQIIHEIYKRPQGNNFPQSYDLGSNGTMKTILRKINLSASDSCTSI
ncbi:probable malonyl-CoA-acyl carrier protein transacylase, mitochondrial, partial [Cotesia glomerata]|uniref:probable malonyl-CoA-acyl carrier protein transacylase, mitochondrial n=1 Tax=Cotesia glomerata TaxID=32391 RepID=UPI001D026141